MNLDGSGFAALHAFSGRPTDGRNPSNDYALTSVGGVLYGMTNGGGIGDAGVLFSLDNSFEISGTVTLGGGAMASVAMTGLQGSPVTDASGHYTLPCRYSGRAR